MYFVTHREIIGAGSAWLRKLNCRIIAEDKRSTTGERPDLIGFRADYSIMIECKSVRPDFVRDKKKPWRVDPDKGMGTFRFYLCPTGMISPHEIPKKWGLLYYTQWKYRYNEMEMIKGPKGNIWLPQKEYIFKRNLEAELRIMYSMFNK
jgi:hypothetical protein